MNTENFDSNSEISALRNQTFNLLIALIVLSGTLTYVLYREASLTGKQLDVLKSQVGQQAANYNKVVPSITNFVNAVGAYGMTHPDIRPLLNKYQIVAAPVQPAPKATK